MMRRLGFTMIELIFAIVVMGIIGKFGVEFLAQAYKSFIFSSVNNALQAKGEMAVESIASRLQYRIKDSVIGRDTDDDSFKAIGSASGSRYNILEWVGSDIEGFRGDSLPNWSGIIDLDDSNATLLDSPETNTTAINNLISILSHGSGTGVNNSAIFFVGADSDINSGYGWDGNVSTINSQDGAMHPVSAVGGQADKFTPTVGSFSGVDVFEYYQLAWTAYAVGIDDYNSSTNTGTLKLWYDYQPWEGDTYLSQVDGTLTKSAIIMEDVSTFQFKSVGSVVKIQVCAKSDIIDGNEPGGYSLCKEKTVF